MIKTLKTLRDNIDINCLFFCFQVSWGFHSPPLICFPLSLLLPLPGSVLSHLHLQFPHSPCFPFSTLLFPILLKLFPTPYPVLFPSSTPFLSSFLPSFYSYPFFYPSLPRLTHTGTKEAPRGTAAGSCYR